EEKVLKMPKRLSHKLLAGSRGFRRIGCTFRLSSLSHLLFLRLCLLPAVMHPEPIRGIPAHSGFEGAVHVGHDGFSRARSVVFARRNLFTGFDTPAGEADAIA